jgi:hypothetical protein
MLDFLKANNNERVKFAFMWANRDWIDIHPFLGCLFLKQGPARIVC